jgi:DNA-binding transcriptional ArsR family regulator
MIDELRVHEMIDEPRVNELSLSRVLHALSDPTRLAVVAQIAAGERPCGALRVGVAKSTLSKHLRVLRKAGITHTRRAGTGRWLSLRRTDLDTRFPGLLEAVMPHPNRPPVVGHRPHPAPNQPGSRYATMSLLTIIRPSDW